MNMKRMVIIAWTLAVSFLSGSQAGAEAIDGSPMMVHHLHLLMNQGFQMVLEGANLEMLAEMRMASSVVRLDTVTFQHGHRMFERGKGIIRRVLDELPRTETPAVSSTRAVGTAMMGVVGRLDELLERASSEDPTKQAHLHLLHHLHVLMDHVLSNANDGSTLILVGTKGMAKEGDPLAVTQGKEVLTEAHAFWEDVTKGRHIMETLIDLTEKEYKAGPSREVVSERTLTRQLAEAGEKLLQLLSQTGAEKR